MVGEVKAIEDVVIFAEDNHLIYLKAFTNAHSYFRKYQIKRTLTSERGTVLQFYCGRGIFLIVSVLLLFISKQSLGIILHPSAEPNLVTWTDRPDSDVVGRWRNNASCVAISRNCIVTTRHQGGASGEVVIGGRSYSIGSIWNHSSADLRVVKLENTNLRHFVNLYTDTDESGQEIRIGGFGKGRGAILQTGGKTYGYSWSGPSNTIQRWCTNKVNSSTTVSGGYVSQVLVADFDGIGEGDSTIYEGTAASWDSGEGWFIYQGGEWKVAALSRGVETHFVEGHEGDPAYRLYEAWFRDRADPNIKTPDYLDGVQISSYASWINSVIPEVLPGDLTGDDWVDISDISVFAGFWSETNCQAPDFCLGADSEPDGDVDWDDFAVLLGNWLSSF